MIRVILIARKPLGEKSIAENALKHGSGGLNIDQTRIACEGENPSIARRKSCTAINYTDENRWQDRRSPEIYKMQRAGEKLGRWPANMILQHKSGCKMIGTKKVAPPNGSGRSSGRGGKESMFGVGDKQKTHGQVEDDGTEMVDVWECVEDCPVLDLKDQSDVTVSSGKGERWQKDASQSWKQKSKDRRRVGYGDKGTADRFFKQVKK